jgi:hypothetical protein
MKFRDSYGEFKTKVKDAFVALRKQGYQCRMNFMCCQSCGWAALSTEGERAVFWHRQDTEGYNDQEPGLYMAWSGDGNEIKKALEDAGLKVEWDGTRDGRIWVELKPALEIKPVLMPQSEAYLRTMALSIGA